jgi:hypothetical protein
VVRHRDNLDIWNLRAKDARFIGEVDDVDDQQFSVYCCDEEYVAYISKGDKLTTVYHIADKRKPKLTEQHKLAQLFKGSVYYGSGIITAARLNDNMTTGD